MPSLLPFAFAAVSASDLLLLDVREDSYSLVADAVARPGAAGEILQPLGVALTLEAMATLLDAGLADDRAIDPSAQMKPPSRCLPSRDPGGSRPGVRDMLDLVAASADVRRRLRHGMPCSAYQRDRRASSVPEPLLSNMIDRLTTARLFVPTPSRCLPASLITSLFLRRRGVESEIVFGVRTHPFAAHCWVEVGGLLVDDELHRVRAYHPICVAAP